MASEHERLWTLVAQLPGDYEPYGQTSRDASDCSCGCRWYRALEGELGMDWGVCTSVKSHRCGLLTFEHQGCRHFEYDESYVDPFGPDDPSDRGASDGE